MHTYHRRTGLLAAIVLAAPLLAVTPAGASSRTAGEEGAKVFLSSTLALDRAAGTITLPLHEGRHKGAKVWYVVTESSDQEDARRRGVSFSGPIANALGTKAVQSAPVVKGLLTFAGTVDFSPERVVVPGPDAFPPATAQAGAKGDANYSPLVTTDGVVVLNTSQVANASGQHDAITSIDFAARRVTLDTFDGFYDDKRVQYLHQEASVELVAALEGSTWAPNLDAAPGLGVLDANRSARAAIIPVINGPKGPANPQRQGLQSALSGEGDPLNVTQIVPGKGGTRPSGTSRRWCGRRPRSVPVSACGDGRG